MKKTSVIPADSTTAIFAADSKENSVPDTDSFAALLAASVKPAPRRNSLVEGEVICSTKGGYFVNIGQKGDSFVPNEEHGETIELTAGSRYTFFVNSEADENGAVELSFLRAKRWSDMKALVESRETTTARVLDVTPGNSGVSIVVGGLRGFVPRSHVGTHARLDSLKGTEIPVKVLEADMLKGRYGSLVCSHIQAVQEQQDAVLASLQKGQTVPGTVVRIIPEKAQPGQRKDAPRQELGALVDLGGITGLVHRTEVSDDRGSKPSDVLSEGDEIVVEILDIDLERRSVRLSYKRVQQAAFLANLKEGDEIEGIVKREDANIGYFVRLGGCIDGLLHNRELNSSKGNREKLTSGDAVTVKVLRVTEEPNSGRTRIALSRKGL